MYGPVVNELEGGSAKVAELGEVRKSRNCGRHGPTDIVTRRIARNVWLSALGSLKGVV
jgi:hypothetical protein